MDIHIRDQYTTTIYYYLYVHTPPYPLTQANHTTIVIWQPAVGMLGTLILVRAYKYSENKHVVNFDFINFIVKIHCSLTYNKIMNTSS